MTARRASFHVCLTLFRRVRNSQTAGCRLKLIWHCGIHQHFLLNFKIMRSIFPLFYHVNPENHIFDHFTIQTQFIRCQFGGGKPNLIGQLTERTLGIYKK